MRSYRKCPECGIVPKDGRCFAIKCALDAEPTGAREDEAARVRAIRARGGAFHNETADLIESLQSALATARQERDDLKLQLSVVNTDKAAWWEGHDKAIAGAAMRWKQALETPIPKPGVMNEPLESLYRATEFLRARLTELEREGKDAKVALRELVECKDLRDRIDTMATNNPQDWPEYDRLADEYARRKPLAWVAARRALATPPADGGAGGRESDV